MIPRGVTARTRVNDNPVLVEQWEYTVAIAVSIEPPKNHVETG